MLFVRLCTFCFLTIACTNSHTSTNDLSTKESGIKHETQTYATNDTSDVMAKPVVILSLEIPKTKSEDVVITHTGYTLSYNENHEQANWVAYELTKEETVACVKRANKFTVDEKVKTGTANDKDYKHSGYDRGHLAPAADMAWSATAMKESFYYSNMSPQEQSFNRGIWKKLEEKVRDWAVENKSIYIVVGPVLSDNLPTIGNNKVSVPKYFYKVILDYTEPDIKAIGFIMPNADSDKKLQNFAVSIDSVETLTGIDFFPSLPNNQETIIESKMNISVWSW